MANKIELRASDLSIGEFEDKRTGEVREIVRIVFHTALDPVFIQEMKEAGVSKYVVGDLEAKKPKAVDLRGKGKVEETEDEEEAEEVDE